MKIWVFKMCSLMPFFAFMFVLSTVALIITGGPGVSQTSRSLKTDQSSQAKMPTPRASPVLNKSSSYVRACITEKQKSVAPSERSSSVDVVVVSVEVSVPVRVLISVVVGVLVVDARMLDVVLFVVVVTVFVEDDEASTTTLSAALPSPSPPASARWREWLRGGGGPAPRGGAAGAAAARLGTDVQRAARRPLAGLERWRWARGDAAANLGGQTRAFPWILADYSGAAAGLRWQAPRRGLSEES
mmetsp:Transcript_39686/g.113783  ORF Transcript_39686/g.113783 Transcript_39686/m.113783 type:complete len:244 (-) Transcript_39686:529-1260(-)